MVDPFHTLFGIAGLSLLGDTSIDNVNPVFCMPERVIQRHKVKYQILESWYTANITDSLSRLSNSFCPMFLWQSSVTITYELFSNLPNFPTISCFQKWYSNLLFLMTYCYFVSSCRAAVIVRLFANWNWSNFYKYRTSAPAPNFELRICLFPWHFY